MRVGFVASSVLHGSILVLALVSFASPRPFVMEEAIPVEVVTSDIAKATKGVDKGKKDEPPKVVAEKVDVEKPTPDPTVKVTEKQEVAPTAPTPPPPPPKLEEPKPPTPPAPAPAKAEPPPPKADEALKSEPKKEDPKPQQQAQPTPLPPKKPAPPPVQAAEPKPPTDQKFNADRIAELLDKRTPQRQAATAAQTSQVASLGTQRGQAQAVSQSELGAFKRKVEQCWKAPPGNNDEMFVDIELRLNRDGTLSQSPVVSGGPTNPELRGKFDAFASSAIRALLQCQPYTMFRPETYDQWKELLPRFTPQMFGGA